MLDATIPYVNACCQCAREWFILVREGGSGMHTYAVGYGFDHGIFVGIYFLHMARLVPRYVYTKLYRVWVKCIPNQLVRMVYLFILMH